LREEKQFTFSLTVERRRRRLQDVLLSNVFGLYTKYAILMSFLSAEVMYEARPHFNFIIRNKGASSQQQSVKRAHCFLLSRGE